MRAKVTLFLPSHHEDHVSVETDHVYCQDGAMYDVVEDSLDLDELEEWKEGTTMDKLMLTILVDIKHFIFEYKSSGSAELDGSLSTDVDTVELTEVTVPGINQSFADVDSDNEEAVDWLYKLIASR